MRFTGLVRVKVPMAVGALAVGVGFFALWAVGESSKAERMAAPACSVACSDSPTDVALRSGAVDARVAIQEVLDASIPGVTVSLPPGEFTISGPVSVPDGVSLTGAGAAATTITARAEWRWAFRYGFLITADQRDGTTSAGATVRDLTLNGGFAEPQAEDEHVVGGVKVGNGWSVRRVNFSDLGYFKVWIYSVSGVSVSGCEFDDSRVGISSGHDNIGGGDATDIELRNNRFLAGANGNAIDLVRAAGIRIVGNEVAGTAEQSRSIYLEGVRDAEVSGNVLNHGSIAVQSNADYADHPEVINPAGVAVVGNTVTEAPAQAISVRYDAPRAGQPMTVESGAVGGGNVVAGNRTENSAVAGILIIAAEPGLAATADEVSGNTVADAFTRGVSEWNCGYGFTAAAGIVVGAAEGTSVVDNLVTGTTEGRPRYGVQVGIRNTRGVTAEVTDVESTKIAGRVERAVLYSG